MVLKISLTERTDRRRNKLWRECGKVKNNRLEFMGVFDSRVYELGLEALRAKIVTGLKDRRGRDVCVGDVIKIKKSK